MERTKLKDRILPPYTRVEDRANMITHIIGGGIGILTLVFPSELGKFPFYASFAVYLKRFPTNVLSFPR